MGNSLTMAFLATATVLAWCGLFAAGWAWVCVRWQTGRALPHAAPRAALSGPLPAMVLAPLLLVTAHALGGLNLLAPVAVTADAATSVTSSMAPALVLLLASGLATALYREVQTEVAHWSARPFTRTALAFGIPRRRTLSRLVLAQALTGAASATLPWLYSELIVIEAIFNAPGLGGEAWHAARRRDGAALLVTVAGMGALYAASVWSCSWARRRLGRRLASYA